MHTYTTLTTFLPRPKTQADATRYGIRALSKQGDFVNVPIFFYVGPFPRRVSGTRNFPHGLDSKSINAQQDQNKPTNQTYRGAERTQSLIDFDESQTRQNKLKPTQRRGASIGTQRNT